jgi:sigma-E factor negative regulatory protein RseC
MKASVCIEQKGTVEEISDRNIRVKICRDASCGHCSASGLCFLGESTERTVEIDHFTSGLKLGDSVVISISRNMGNKAVVLSYLVPFVLLMVVLFLLNSLEFREWVTGLLALTALVPYFFLLYLFRNRLSKSFTFSVRKND